MGRELVRRLLRGVGSARHFLALSMIVLGISSSRRVAAQTTDSAVAEELFQQGQTLMQAQKYSEACPKLAESQRLDPSTGTLLNLAVCHEKEGKLASAWGEFNDALSRSKRDGRSDRAQFAEEHIKAIEPNLSRLALNVAPQAAQPGLHVKLDESDIGQGAWGVALPVNPGTHRIEVSAPSKKTWTAHVEVAAGPSTQAVTIPELLDAPPGQMAEEAAPTEPPRDGSTQRLVAYGLGGLGLVGLGVGTIFGVDALGKFDQSNTDGCNEDQCNDAGAAHRNAARQSGDIATIAFIVGGAALGAGVVLYVTAPAGPAQDSVAFQTRLRPTLGGASVEWGATW